MNSSRGGWPGAPASSSSGALLPSVLAALGVGGLAGNALLAAVLAREVRRGRGGPAEALLLLNVCAADVLLALACLPPRLAAYARRSGPPGATAAACRAAAWLLPACLGAKSLSWAALGRARLRLARSPSDWSVGRLAAGLGALWAWALLLPLPLLLFSRPAGGPLGQPARCAFRPPADAAAFADVFGLLYPLAAFVAPAAFSWAGYGRALRLETGRKARPAAAGRPSPRSPGALLGLCLLFQASWLPAWVAWLWERRSAPGAGPPPPALAALADVLVFLDAACPPAVLAAASGDFRRRLRSLCRGLPCCARRKEAPAPAEAAQALQELPRDAPADKVLPDVEHFWKDRSNTADGEESDPVPWEHQAQP
ncbi:G-protein coupled receptor 151 protein-like [Paroedura picta]|uniref:G-protein coupled receptor 151 protein-like n=1 Tax=Paroedura picta TaxID=143630 RepID=UPI00405783CA